MKIDSTDFEKKRAIFSASGVEGRKRPFSIATIVWRLTPTASASCCWVTDISALSTLILFFISIHLVVVPHLHTEEEYIDERKQNEIQRHELEIFHSVNKQSARNKQHNVGIK